MIKSNKEENRKEGMRLHLLKGIGYTSDLMIKAVGLDAARYLWFDEEASKVFSTLRLTGEKLDEIEPTYKKTKNHVCICKSKISGSNNPMYGKHHTEESKRKMREGKKRQWKAQRGSR